jgi:hypothetical protein
MAIDLQDILSTSKLETGWLIFTTGNPFIGLIIFICYNKSCFWTAGHTSNFATLLFLDRSLVQLSFTTIDPFSFLTTFTHITGSQSIRKQAVVCQDCKAMWPRYSNHRRIKKLWISFQRGARRAKLLQTTNTWFLFIKPLCIHGRA